MRVAVLLLLLAVPAQAEMVCDGLTDTSVGLQSALTAGGVVILPANQVCIARNLTMESNTHLWLNGSTLDVRANTGTRTWMLQTRPGAVNVYIHGPGTIKGSRTTPVGQWSIGVRFDSVCPPEAPEPCDALMEGVTLLDWATDGAWVGGNSKTTRLTLRRNTFRGAGRNGAAIVNADRVTVEQNVFSETTPLSGDPNPAAGLDVEPNPGESVDNLIVRNNVFSSNRGPGLYDHDGRGLRGRSHRIVGNAFLANGGAPTPRFALVLNGVIGAVVADNYILGSQGVSIGGFTPQRLAERVTFVGNTIEGAGIGLRFAGVTGLTATDNSVPPSQAGLGIIGDAVLLRNGPN